MCDSRSKELIDKTLLPCQKKVLNNIGITLRELMPASLSRPTQACSLYTIKYKVAPSKHIIIIIYHKHKTPSIQIQSGVYTQTLQHIQVLE